MTELVLNFGLIFLFSWLFLTLPDFPPQIDEPDPPKHHKMVADWLVWVSGMVGSGCGVPWGCPGAVWDLVFQKVRCSFGAQISSFLIGRQPKKKLALEAPEVLNPHVDSFPHEAQWKWLPTPPKHH